MPNRAASRPTRRRLLAAPIAGLVAGILLTTAVTAAHAESTTTAARDTFSRSVSSGWGTATTGGSWTVSKPAATALRVASGKASVAGLAPAKSFTATLKSTRAADVSMKGSFQLATSIPVVYHAYQVRLQSDGSAYRGRIEVLKGGKVDLVISRVTSGNKEVALARKRMPFVAKTSTPIKSEISVSGTSPVTISARGWTKAAVPAWQLTAKDTASSRITSSGAVGVWQYSSAANSKAVRSVEDNITVTTNPIATPVETPQTPGSGTTAPTTPTLPAVPAAASRGSLAVGSASYAVPAGALIVSPSGSDSNAGTLAEPLRTVAAAIAKATAGKTIVLRAGTYNESVSIPESKPNLTVQAYPKEAVWFDGSVPVTNWVRSGSTWVSSGWTSFYTHVMDGVADNPYFVSAAHPLAARSDMVFVDGTQLVQVASAADVVSGTFAVNESAKTITIGSDPSGHAVRASNQMQAIYAKSTGTTLQGFGVRRYATPYNVRGALRLGGVGQTARNIVVQDSASTGMNVENDDITLDHLTVERSGMQGVGINASYGLSFTNSVITSANTEQFNEAPVSGGVKMTRTRDFRIADNDFTASRSFGLWLDESCYDGSVTGNTVTGNAGHGIEVEISANIIVADNVVTSNGKSGIRLLNTSETRIVNNSLGGNKVFDIQLSQDERRESDLSVPGHDPRRPKPDPQFSWLTVNDTVANNVFGSAAQFQIYALDNWTGVPVDKWNVTITGNLFNAVPTGPYASSTVVAWGGSDKVTLTRYSTAAALAKAKGPTWTNSQMSTITPLSGMAASAKAAAGDAVPLPADIAKAVGQPTGTKHVGAF